MGNRSSQIDRGFEKPSDIQERGVVSDVDIQQALSGTGETAALCPKIMQKLDYGEVGCLCNALVIVRSSEAAERIYSEMLFNGVYVHTCVAVGNDVKPYLCSRVDDEPTLNRFKDFKHIYANVLCSSHKVFMLSTILGHIQKAHTQSVIFVDKVESVGWLADQINRRGHNIVETLQKSMPGNLITADHLVRGIDVQQVSVVINYDFPAGPHVYFNRISRFESKGVAINLVDVKDLHILMGIESFGVQVNEWHDTDVDDIF